MGKAMSRSIKAKGRAVIDKYKEDLTVDFTRNKELVKKLELPFSRKTINLMAGFITREMKKLAVAD